MSSYGLFSSKVLHFAGQDYNKLKAKCLEKMSYFEDPAFPAENSSLYRSSGSDLAGQRVEWKRPHELCSSPKLFVGGANSLDVKQGSLGNCWFVAACGDLANHKSLLEQVVVDKDEQSFEKGQYAGIFRFRFWIFGQWTDVVIDDRLPTIGGKLVYVFSVSNNEFWPSLLEKAYAKLHQCYENLESGNPGDALVNFTSGITETIDLKGPDAAPGDARKELFKTLTKAFKRDGLMSAWIVARNRSEQEAHTSRGLVMGHAYGVTKVMLVNKIPMIRLRNPWGQKEWNGPWSDGSPEWASLSSNEKKKIGLVNEDDGEFWMTLDDFIENYTSIGICRVVNTSLLSIHKTWRLSMLHNEWKGSTCAGSSFGKNFLANPQYVFTQHADGQVILALMQQDSRPERHLGKQNLSIGLSVMKVEENREYRLAAPQNVVGTVAYSSSREIVGRFHLPQGRYVVIPSTFKENQEGKFLLRLFTEKQTYCYRMARDAPPPLYCSCIFKDAIGVVRVTCVSATGLEKQDMIGSADPYCYVKLNSSTASTPVVKDSLEPNWNSSLLFYVKKISQSTHVTVQVWNYNLVKDYFMGEVKIALSEFVPKKGQTFEKTMKLMDKKSQKETHGTIVVRFMYQDELVL